MQSQPEGDGLVTPGPRRDHDAFAVARGLGRGEHVGDAADPVLSVVDDRQQVVTPTALARRPVARRRGVAAVGDETAGEPEREPVVRGEHLGDSREHVGLDTAQPGELGDRVRRVGDGATRRAPSVGTAQLVDEDLGVDTGVEVGPDLGGTQGVAAGVEDDQAVGGRRDGHGAHTEGASGRVPRLDERVPPFRGIKVTPGPGGDRVGRASGRVEVAVLRIA